VREVCEEIERVGHHHVFFVDDNIFVDVTKATELFRALIPLKITWSCQCSIDIARDPALVKLMQQSGCTMALFGFESLDRDNLQQMKKGWNLKVQDYETSIRVLQDSGIMIYGTFVFGYDHDTVDSFDRAVEFSIRHKFYLANFNPLTPTPRAPLFDRLEREGRLIHDRWWIDPRFRYGDATFHPRGMTADQLTAGCYAPAPRSTPTARSWVACSTCARTSAARSVSEFICCPTRSRGVRSITSRDCRWAGRRRSFRWCGTRENHVRQADDRPVGAQPLHRRGADGAPPARCAGGIDASRRRVRALRRSHRGRPLR